MEHTLVKIDTIGVSFEEKSQLLSIRDLYRGENRGLVWSENQIRRHFVFQEDASSVAQKVHINQA